jgi:hypothetical protein
MKKIQDYGMMKTAGIIVVLMLVTIGLSAISCLNIHNEKTTSPILKGQITDTSFMSGKAYLCNNYCLAQYRDCHALGGCNDPNWISDCTDGCMNGVPTAGPSPSGPHAPPLE